VSTPTPILLILKIYKMDKQQISIADYLQRIDERQQNIEKMLLSQKNVLTFDEAATFIGISKSHLYKLTMANSLPFYRPRGKMIYMDRVELENWLLQNRITPADELEAKASTYVTLNKGRA
jgi:excisionase family DNA binding protein